LIYVNGFWATYRIGGGNSKFWKIQREGTMAQEKAQAERSVESAPVLMASAEFGEMWKKGFEGFLHAHEDFMHGLNETSRHWLDRIQLEAKVASEFGSKMAGSRSLPEALTVGQEWASQHFKMMTEDRKHLLEDCQHFTAISGRLLANGLISKRSDTGTQQ
jgi:hypothetical protein